MSAEIVLLVAIVSYSGIGLAVAAAFLAAGVRRVFNTHGSTAAVSLTPGARLLILPGLAALWPYVLLRWRRALRRS